MFGRIAQLVEQKTLNLLVGGSSPPAPTFQVTRSLVDFLLGLEGRRKCEFVQSTRRTRESRPAGIFRQGEITGTASPPVPTLAITPILCYNTW